MVEPSYRTFLEYDVSSGNWLWESKTATRIASRPLNLWAAALGRCSYGQHNRPVEGARMGSFGQCGRSGFLIVQRQTPNPASNGRRTPGREIANFINRGTRGDRRRSGYLDIYPEDESNLVHVYFGAQNAPRSGRRQAGPRESNRASQRRPPTLLLREHLLQADSSEAQSEITCNNNDTTTTPMM